jgi:hypothetical protein
MIVEKLNEDNFQLFAMQNYDNPHLSMQEFDEDMKRFLYLKKLLTRYRMNGDLRERLILNHIIILYNIFGKAATRMLFYKIDEENWNILTTFLVYLGFMPERIKEFDIITADIELDSDIIKVLRNL